jgi:hypothetical protein
MLYNPVHTSFDESIHVSVKVVEELSAVEEEVLNAWDTMSNDQF